MQNSPLRSIATLTMLTMLAVALPVAAQSEESDAVAPLLSGMGVYSRPISTESILAQRYFDQGLTLTFGYYFVHAVGSFQEAIRHDPDNGMLHWGMALAIGPNPNSRAGRLPDDPQGEGKRAITRAMELRESASHVERALIEALNARFDDDARPNRARRDTAYIKAMQKIHKRYPDDLDAGFLLADAIMTNTPWRYWDIDGQPKKGTMEAANALTQTLDAHPLHPGANHLYIHLVEASHQPDLATSSANRLASLTPHAGHVVHMPSHIFIRTGRYQDATNTNLRSVEVDDIVREEWGDYPYPMICTYNVSAKTHTGHATDFIRLASMFEGNYELAIEYARITAGTGPLDSVSNGVLRHVAGPWLVHKIFGKWDALKAEPAPPESNPYLFGMWSYVQGSRLVHEGNLSDAEKSLAKIQELQAHPDVQELLVRANPASMVLEVAALMLAGELANARGDHATATQAFAEAAAKEDAFRYTEPPDWAQSPRLYLGDAHLKNGDPTAAETAFREDLLDFPINGWALHGLWKSLEAQGKTIEASEARERFEKAWERSDTPLGTIVF